VDGVKARAQIVVDGRISDAEALWYDTRRWPTFVDGFHHVADGLDSGWPERGELLWDSVPNGRGRVWERVTRFEARVGQWATIEDEQIHGKQTITFTALEGERVRVVLELAYEVKVRRGGPLFAVVDALFIRPRQREALQRTLNRFARELVAERSEV
jgi:uncharacterized membrane protein